MGSRLMMLAGKVRAFLRARRGNVAMMFALALVPLTVAAGAGVDYTRALMVHQQMNEALDAAALAIGSTSGMNQASAQALAQSYFTTNYQIDSSFGVPGTPTVTFNSNGSVAISVTTNMPTVLMKIVGIDSLPVTASSTVVWGQSKLWVALVLDNSGSMSQGDSGGSKMQALQNASKQLLTILQNASATPGDVQVSIVPFVSDVNVGTSNVSASWLDFSQDWNQSPLTNPNTNAHQLDTDIMPAGDPLDSYGPGDKCPYTASTFGYICNGSPPNNSNCSPQSSSGCVSTIPSSGTYKGYICPSMHEGGTQDGMGYHFYNGCWTGTTASGSLYTVSTGSSATCGNHSSSNCSCSGSGNSKTCKTKIYHHTWVANSTSTWDGCLWDREKTPAAGSDYDETNTTPSSGFQLFVPENMLYCAVATVTPLGYNWTNLTTQINAMTAYGATNQAIGVEHGWQTITPGTPYGAPALPANTAQYIILLSDGLNTMDRWYGDGSTENTTADGNIDTREEATCTAAKNAGVIIYTILLDIGAGSDSNSAPLQACASDSSKYFVLTSTSAIVTTFNQIAQQITDVRVSQ